jgi:folate-binding protein YgfZ
MDEDVLAMEMDLQSAISSSKGCYLGQETVERVSARGHVNRRRTVFALDGDVVPTLPSTVYAGDKEVGRITSAGHSFLRQSLLGLGLLHVKALEAGAPLRAGTGNVAIACAPLALPLTPGRAGG